MFGFKWCDRCKEAEQLSGLTQPVGHSSESDRLPGRGVTSDVPSIKVYSFVILLEVPAVCFVYNTIY